MVRCKSVGIDGHLFCMHTHQSAHSLHSVFAACFSKYCMRVPSLHSIHLNTYSTLPVLSLYVHAFGTLCPGAREDATQRF